MGSGAGPQTNGDALRAAVEREGGADASPGWILLRYGDRRAQLILRLRAMWGVSEVVATAAVDAWLAAPVDQV